MKRSALLLVLLAAACAVLAGDSSGAASGYPTPLYLGNTASVVTGSLKLDAVAGSSGDSTTNNIPALNDTGWYVFAPRTSSSTQLSSIPTTPDGTGFIVDPIGGATGFPAGNWTFTVKTDIPDATLVAGAAVLTVGMWKGGISGSSFVSSGTLVTPTDDPSAQNLRSSTSPVTTSVTYSVPKFSLAAGETLFVELWRHQTAGINDAAASRRELDLTVNDGSATIAHPTADDTGPVHSLSVVAVSGSTYFDSSTSTVYFNGGAAGSFKVDDAITDSGAGNYHVTYPLVSTTGWTHAAETASTSPSFESSAFSWVAGSTTSPGALSIVAEDLALQTSTGTVTATNDSTAPSGQTVALSSGPGYSALSVPLTLGNGSDVGAGLDASSWVVQRASATLSNGSCGSFGSFAPVTLTSGADATVTTGNCYRYQYLISDLVANQSSASSSSADALVDTSVPTVADTAPTEVTGAGDQYWDSATDTLWFRPAGSGSFTMNANAADGESGIAQVAFPDVSAIAGWAGSTGGTDSSSTYSSPVAYSWTAAAAAPGSRGVMATNGTSLTANDAMIFTADSTAPSGQTVALSGGPWYTTLSVPLTLGSGLDTSGSGVDASRGIVERATAPLTNGSCGTYGSFAAVTLSAGADTTVASGNCYRYQYKATDNVGNVSAASTATADAKIDSTVPTAPTLQFSGLTNAAASGSTVYYRPTGSGSFTVTASSLDSDSGVSTYTFPTVPGFTVIGAGPSRTYTFSTAPSAPLAPLSVTATNGAGLSSTAGTFTLVPDPTPPTLTVRCDGKPCLKTAYQKAVAVSLAATDDSGSGVETIRYTTDGTDPSIDDGTEYVAPFTLKTLTTLTVRAYDKAGNASNPFKVTIRSLADRLIFSAPVQVSVKAKARYFQARVSSSARASITAVMTGPGLRTPQRWRFVLSTGSSIVQLKLPTTLRTGRYTLVWNAQAGTHKAAKTTRVVLGLPHT